MKVSVIDMMMKLKTLVNNVGADLQYEVNAVNCPGFKNQMTVGF